MKNLLIPAVLIGGGVALAGGKKKKKKKSKKSSSESISSLYLEGATAGAAPDFSTYVKAPIGIAKEGSNIQFKEFVKHPTVMPEIQFKFPKGAKGNAEVAGKVVSAVMFAQGPNYGKLLVDGGDFELEGTGNAKHLVTNIKGPKAKRILEEMMALVSQEGYDLSQPGPTLVDAIDRVLAKVAPNVTMPADYEPGSKVAKVRAGTALLGQLAYQSWWNQQ